MILNRPQLRAEFTRRGLCEWCGKPANLDCAHILSVGAGRVDIRPNLVSLCRACHTSQHGGNEPTPEALLLVAAQREGLLQDKIREAVWMVRRLPKETTVELCEHKLVLLLGDNFVW